MDLRQRPRTEEMKPKSGFAINGPLACGYWRRALPATVQFALCGASIMKTTCWSCQPAGALQSRSKRTAARTPAGVGVTMRWLTLSRGSVFSRGRMELSLTATSSSQMRPPMCLPQRQKGKTRLRRALTASFSAVPASRPIPRWKNHTRRPLQGCSARPAATQPCSSKSCASLDSRRAQSSGGMTTHLLPRLFRSCLVAPG